MGKLQLQNGSPQTNLWHNGGDIYLLYKVCGTISGVNH